MTDRAPIDPIEVLLRQPDRPETPSPAFARRLRERIADESTPPATTKGATPMPPTAPAFPVSPPGPSHNGRVGPPPRSWMRVVEIAAVLVLMVGAVGGYLGAGRFWVGRSGVAPVAGTPTGAADGTAAMWGGDAGRTGAQPGPGPAGEVALRWRSPADEGYVSGSAPVALGDRVYRSAFVSAPTEAGSAVSTFVEAFDAGTGRRLWRTELDIFGAPAATERTVYVTVNGWVGDTEGHTTSALVALDAPTGGEAWRARTGNLFGGMATSPIVLDGSVYVADPDGTVYAHDAATGTQRWVSTVARADGSLLELAPLGSAFGGAGTLAVGNGAVYVVNGRGELVALDDGGDERWRLDPRERFGIAPELMVPTAIDGAVVIRVRGIDESSASRAPTGLVAAVEAASGAARWTERDTLGFGGVAVAGDLVLVTRPHAEDASVVALDAGTGARRWEFPGLRGVFVALGVAGDVAYVTAQEDAMRAVEVQTGEELWRSAAGGTVRLPPAVADGAVFVTDDAGTLSALTADGDRATPTAP